MRIIFILILIFLPNAGWSFIDYKYLICEIDNPKDENLSIDKRFLFFTINKGEYMEEIIKIDRSKEKIDISKERYKNGFYTFDDNSIYFKERLFFRKIKLNRKLDRKSLKLTTHNNDRFETNHNCSITNMADYEKKIFDNITKLKEIWKNNYKDNKM
tara:strand:+ start:140 stop:610 length:471 start_codon:yes stop_codon:yes gene_type:complete